MRFDFLDSEIQNLEFSNDLECLLVNIKVVVVDSIYILQLISF